MFSGGNWGEDRGGGRPRGERGERMSTGKGAKDLSEEKEKDLRGGKGLRRKRGEGSQQGTGGERS